LGVVWENLGWSKRYEQSQKINNNNPKTQYFVKPPFASIMRRYLHAKNNKISYFANNAPVHQLVYFPLKPLGFGFGGL
jgi:hypothetical protein